ncbi:hypothetical protein [Staphylococcus gallinarum]|uniref:hypothetical protein n=1 Tax=Staphylococcus gallinarum TaxID=1293 RepID=UPI0030EE51B4
MEIFENEIGFINRNLIYRTAIKNETDGLNKIDTYLNKRFIKFEKVEKMQYNELKYYYNVQNYNGFWSLIGFRFENLEI